MQGNGALLGWRARGSWGTFRLVCPSCFPQRSQYLCRARLLPVRHLRALPGNVSGGRGHSAQAEAERVTMVTRTRIRVFGGVGGGGGVMRRGGLKAVFNRGHVFTKHKLT